MHALRPTFRRTASPATTAAPQTPPTPPAPQPSAVQRELAAQLRNVSDTLGGSDAGASAGDLALLCGDLLHVRQLLIEDGAAAREAFRVCDGFGVVVAGVLGALRGFYYHEDTADPLLSRDARTDFFELVKVVLDVLSEAVNACPANRRFFRNRVLNGGWGALERLLVETGLGRPEVIESVPADDGLEILFGILLAFGTAEENMKGAIRGVQRLFDQELKRSDSEAHTRAENEVRSYVQGRFSGHEVLQNPDIVPVIIRFWTLILNSCENSGNTTALLFAIPAALQGIQSSSERNEVAMYDSHALKELLPLFFKETKFPRVKEVLQNIIENLLKYGVNSIQDARLLLQHAAESEPASRLLLHGIVASRMSHFLQFDLSLHGYSSIELSTLGRPFPPTSSSSGYTIMTWIRFDRFDPYFQTAIFGASDDSETTFVALSVDKDDRHLVLQTSVKALPKSVVRFTGMQFLEGTWYHVALIHQKPRRGHNGNLTLYVNGSFLEVHSCRYPSLPPVRSSSAESFASITGSFQQHAPVRAFLGTPQSLAQRQGQNMDYTKWSMASFHLVHEALAEPLAQVCFALGPRYVGNFQDTLSSFLSYRKSADLHLINELMNPEQPEKSRLFAALNRNAGSQLPEAKVVISFSATGVLDSEDRNLMNETRLIRSLSKDSAKTLQQTIKLRGASLIFNSAVPSYNDAIMQPHGVAILTGNPVVSIPNAIDDACWMIGGGPAVVLKLLDLARTKCQVLRAVHITFQSLEGSWRNSEAMERCSGYGVLAGLMREKLGFGSIFGDTNSGRQPTPVALEEREELALELLRMTLSFVGYSETRPEQALINNGLAYRSLLVEFDTWRKAPIATQKLYYSQFVHFAVKGVNHKYNAKRLIRMRIVKRFIDALKGESFEADVFPDFLDAFGAVFRCSVSSETLKSVPPFITFALHENRAFPYRTSPARPSSAHGTDGSDHPRPKSGAGGRERSSSRVSPFNPPITPSVELSRYEVGVHMLQLYAELLCEANDLMVKFTKAVSAGWLLYLLAERDSRVVVLATKILVRSLIVNGPTRVKQFSERYSGFTIMKRRLKPWWSVPALWINLFCLLFGIDPERVQYVDNFHQFTLSDIFAEANGIVVYPDVLPVIMALLANGVRSNPQRQKIQISESDSASMKSQGFLSTNTEIAGHDSSEAFGNEVIDGVCQYLLVLTQTYPKFREFADNSSFLQELMFVLYPNLVKQEIWSVEKEMEVNRSKQYSSEPQTPDSNSHQRVLVNRTRSDPSVAERRPAGRRSSFVIISSDNIANSPKISLLMPFVFPTGYNPSTVKVDNRNVRILLDVAVFILADQALHKKDFTGFGIYFRVPPGFEEDQINFESFILLSTLSRLAEILKARDKFGTDSRVITNISKYVYHMAESLFEGWFQSGADRLLDFIGQVLEFLQRPEIAALKSVQLCSHGVVSMKRAFHRITLKRLSEGDEFNNPREIVAFLTKLKYWQSVALTADCDGQHYLRLLFFLLYQRLLSKLPDIRTSTIDFWRILMVHRFSDSSLLLNSAAPPNKRYLADGFLKLAEIDNEAFLVWVDNNREELDQLFIKSLGNNWESFVASENEGTQSIGASRLSKRKAKVKQWHDEDSAAEMAWRKHDGGIGNWRNNVYSGERLKYQRAVQDQNDNLAFMASTLAKFDRILRGPCALFEEDMGSKCRLDETEGQNRVRLRIIPDRSTQEEYQPKYKTSDNPRRSSSQIKVVAANGRERRITSSSGPLVQEPGSLLPDGRSRSDSRSSQAGAAGEDEYEIIDNPRTDEGEFEDKNRKVMRSLQQRDVIEHVHNVSRIEGLEAVEGLLIIGKYFFYLIDHYFQRADGEVVGVWQAPAEERDPYMWMISGRETVMRKPRVSPGERTTRHWKWDDVMLISKRRFILRDVAMEIFFTDGRSYLLTSISCDTRNELYSKLISKTTLINNPSSAALHPDDQWRMESLRNIEDQPQSIKSMMSSVFPSAVSNQATKKWIRGEISNFSYLMQINTMAGRTFNDLTQYPVFPWVIADYTSDELDLTNPRTFRDLSKPMGCQHPSREYEFQLRYESTKDMSEDPPYHYGTHYSSAMTVCQYLMRLQPFVKSYLLLQGGSFDHADRLFYSIGQAWISASKENTTDVRELTPEFFYLPEFLVNINGYNFGQRQATGEGIDNVILPPWAKGDPHIFIQKHREALESPHVSAHLHEWIDLIFGYKQQGEAAVQATNVFHFLSYQGAKDLDAIEDPRERLAAIGIIHNFGQTPQQIFQRAHPARDETPRGRGVADLNAIVGHISRSHVPLLESRDPITNLVLQPKSSERFVASGPVQLPVPPFFDAVMRWGYSDGSVRFHAAASSRDSGIGNLGGSGGGGGFGGKKLLALYENLHLGAPSTAVFVDSRTLVTAGADAVVCLWHVAPATTPSAAASAAAAAAAAVGAASAAGGGGGSAAASSSPVAGKPLELVHRAALFGHRAPVALLAASKSLATLLSADATGRVLLWDLNGGEFVRELRAGGGGGAAAGVAASGAPVGAGAVVRAARISSATGEIAVAVGRAVELYSINGDRLLRHNVADERDPGDYVTCLAWYEGLRGEWVERILLLTGHRSGVTKIWHKVIDPQTNRWTLRLVRRLAVNNSQSHLGAQQVHAPAITCILPTSRAVLTGDDHGRVFEWTSDN